MIFRTSFRPALFALLLGAALSRGAFAAPLAVYDEQLRNGFADWSWATHSLTQTSVVRTGSVAGSFEPDAWGAFFLHRDLGIGTTEFEALEFWIRGAAPGGQNLRVALASGGTPVAEAALGPFIAGGTIPVGSWAKVTVPFSSLGVTSGSFDGFWLQDGTGGNQTAVYVDDVVLIDRPVGPPTPVTVSVDPEADRKRINPLIYGVNFGTSAQMAGMRWPVRRWGGNAVTRYSWQHDIANHANDWYFYNIEESNPTPGNLPNGSTADRFIDETRASGGEPLMTVPLIGWTPIDRQRRWGFSVTKYGAQQKTECSEPGSAGWCQADAGNGLRANGTPVTGNDPHDTSREIAPDFVTGWLSHIAGRTGNAGSGGVQFFGLDNEPMLWSSTHRDVHPVKVHDTELWQRTAQYAAAIKAAHPNAKLFGPDTWGWCDLFYSEADNCAQGSDYAAHGPFIPWYLDQLRAHQLATGVRLIDYLDLHWYPQGTNIALTNDESEGTSARRLRSLKALYDPDYVDESWIGRKIFLLRQAKQWIDGHLPGLGLAITEYNFGDGTTSSALAQAEALAIFGREGVDLATRWVSPQPNSLVEDAFRMFLNYDGAGAKVDGDSVRTLSSDVDAVGAYAVRGTGTRLWVLLFNKDTRARSTTVQLPVGRTFSGNAQLYRFQENQRLASAGTAAPSSGALTVSLPARSATLARVELGGGVAPAGTGFYTLTPCRLVDTRGSDPLNGAPRLAAGATRTFAAAGRCGVPAGAKAVAVNLTVVSPNAIGTLTGFAGGTTAPNTNVVAFGPGQTRAAMAILSLSNDGNGTLSLKASGADTQAIVDVFGWFQ